MRCSYNIDLQFENTGRLTEPEYNSVRAALQREGLIGEYSVNTKGRLHHGFDISLGYFSIAKFMLLTFPLDMEFSLRQLQHRYESLEYGEDLNHLLIDLHLTNLLDEIEETAQDSAKADYAEIPLSVMTGFHILPTRQILTIFGYQMADFYDTSKKDMIRFWHPQGTSTWYDIDFLYDYLNAMHLARDKLVTYLTDTNNQNLEARIKRVLRKLNPLMKLLEELERNKERVPKSVLEAAKL